MRRRTFLAGASMILPGLNPGLLLGGGAGGGGAGGGGAGSDATFLGFRMQPALGTDASFSAGVYPGGRIDHARLIYDTAGGTHTTGRYTAGATVAGMYPVLTQHIWLGSTGWNGDARNHILRNGGEISSNATTRIRGQLTSTRLHWDTAVAGDYYEGYLQDSNIPRHSENMFLSGYFLPSDQVALEVSRSGAGQSTTNSVWNRIALDTLNIDPHGGWDGGANTYTVPAALDGKVGVFRFGTSSETDASSYSASRITRNGASVAQAGRSDTYDCREQGMVAVDLVAGDVYALDFICGVNKTLQGWRNHMSLTVFEPAGCCLMRADTVVNYASGDQTVQWDTTVLDPLSQADLANNRIVIAPELDGHYVELVANFMTPTTVGGDDNEVRIERNGTEIVAYFRTGVDLQMRCSPLTTGPMQVAAGDVFDVTVNMLAARDSYHEAVNFGMVDLGVAPS